MPATPAAMAMPRATPLSVVVRARSARVDASRGAAGNPKLARSASAPSAVVGFRRGCGSVRAHRTRISASYERGSVSDPTRVPRDRPPPEYPPAPARGRLPPGGGGRGPPLPPPSGTSSWLTKLTTPAAIIATAFVLSVTNPQYVDGGREYLLMTLYERQSAERLKASGQYNQAIVRDDVVYKFNKFSGSITATARDGLMVDKDGSIWVVVRYKNNPERVKTAFYIGQSDSLPPLPRDASAKQRDAWEKEVKRQFGPVFAKLPDMREIYDAPEPKVTKRQANLISKQLVERNNVLPPPYE